MKITESIRRLFRSEAMTMPEPHPLLLAFETKHGILSERFRYCPVRGCELKWTVAIEDSAPFNTRTGVGAPFVNVQVSDGSHRIWSGYSYHYNQASQRLNVSHNLRPLGDFESSP